MQDIAALLLPEPAAAAAEGRLCSAGVRTVLLQGQLGV
jgi:hypothetical protein